MMMMMTMIMMMIIMNYPIKRKYLSVLVHPFGISTIWGIIEKQESFRGCENSIV